jgi:hypothetical protein
MKNATYILRSLTDVTAINERCKPGVVRSEPAGAGAWGVLNSNRILKGPPNSFAPVSLPSTYNLHEKKPRFRRSSVAIYRAMALADME